MGGDKKKKMKSKPMFPDIQWWKDSPVKGGSIGGGGGDGQEVIGTNNNNNNNNNTRGLNDNLNDNNMNYGSILPQLSSFDADHHHDDSIEYSNDYNIVDASSDITNSSTIQSNDSDDSSNSDDDDDSSNDEDDDDDDDDDDTIEQPHRTLGLIFFDFLRFVAISVNVRAINTQIVPVFMAWGRMELLHVGLRIFMTIFSLYLILVEFPDLLPRLQHATPNNNNNSNNIDSSTATTTTTTLLPPPPPLSIINWIPRGFFYIFLSTIGFEQSIVVRALDAARNASNSSRFFDGIFIVMSASFMLVVGVVYIVLGMFCIQRVMERVRRDEKEKWKEYYRRVQEEEREREEEEERMWLLENGKMEEGQQQQQPQHGTVGADNYVVEGGGRRCWERVQRWRRRCKRRRKGRKGGGGGFFYRCGCRTVDWRC